MSSPYEGIIEGFNLAGGLKRGQAVVFCGDSVQVAAGAADSRAIGVYDIRDNSDIDAAERTYNVPVTLLGSARVFAGAAVAAGDLLKAGTDGYLIPLDALGAGGKAWVIGRAMQAASADEALDILLTPFEMNGK